MTDQGEHPASQSHAAALTTIPNAYLRLRTSVQLTYPFARLCPVSNEPQPGSTITIQYQAGERLLETKSLQRYLESFAGENPHGVRDLEEAAQVIALACNAVLGSDVHVIARYRLTHGEMEVTVSAGADDTLSTAPASEEKP